MPYSNNSCMNPHPRVRKALKSISTYYPSVDLMQVPIEFSSDIPNLGKYYKATKSIIESVAKAIPSLRYFCHNSQRIVLSTKTLNNPKLSKEFDGIDAVEIVLHHEILHYLIDINHIKCTSDNEEVWIDNKLKDNYRNKNKSTDKYNSGLPIEESQKLEDLIKKFNSDDAYRRKIMMKGNSIIVKGKTSEIKTAEEYLSMMALRSSY